MIRARFRIRLPEGLWVTAVSTAFPDARLRLLTGVPLGDRALELGEVVATAPVTVTDAIRDHPDVRSLDRLYADDRRALTRYETTEQALYEFLGGPSLPPEFPLLVEDGRMEFDVTTTESGFEALGETLDASGLDYDLLSLVHSDRRDDVLTARQRECLEVALREGYFEVPRTSTLAEVAAELGVDTSTASETIRRGAGRVLDRYLLGPTDD